MIDIDVIRDRADSATEGPWVKEESSWSQHNFFEIAPCDSSGNPDWLREVCGTAGNDRSQSERDAEFICRAREDVPALCDEIEKLRAQVDEARAAANFMAGIIRWLASPTTEPRPTVEDGNPHCAAVQRWEREAKT